MTNKYKRYKIKTQMVQDDLIHLEPLFSAQLTGFSMVGSRSTVIFNFLL